MSDSDVSIPLNALEVHARNHGLLCCIGFLIILPIGALIPRYTRTLRYKYVSLPTNQQNFLNPTKRRCLQMVPRTLAHPVPYSRPYHLCRMGTRSSNNRYAGHTTLPGYSSNDWAVPSDSLRPTTGFWRTHSFL
jgi:hypothetical protein